MSDEATYARTYDDLIHAFFFVDGFFYAACGVSFADVTERMFTAELTCLGCLARVQEAKEVLILDAQLRATLAQNRIGEATAIAAVLEGKRRKR